MAKKMSLKDKMVDLIDHMLEHGWVPNHQWLDCLKDSNVDFEQLILGKTGAYSAHLITEDGKYTAKFERKRLYIYQKEPTWRKLGNFPLGKVEKIENGLLYVKKSTIVTEKVEIIIPRTKENMAGDIVGS